MWKPISREEIETLLARELADCSAEEQQLFDPIKVGLTKWQLEPWGNEGGGFWVVAKTPGHVLWYNDIEEGFNTSSYAAEGVISEYGCNQDELRFALRSVVG